MIDVDSNLVTIRADQGQYVTLQNNWGKVGFIEVNIGQLSLFGANHGLFWGSLGPTLANMGQSIRNFANQDNQGQYD